MAISKFKQLVKEANKLGTKIHVVNRVPGAAGHWDPVSNIIRICKKYSPTLRLYFLAHELGHAYYDHHGCYLDQALRQEKQAHHYSEYLAKKFGFYSSYFKRYIKEQREMLTTEWYKEFLVSYGYIRRK